MGNDNISDPETEIDSDEEGLKDLLQQVGEMVSESLLGDDSQFVINQVEKIPFFDKSTYETSDPESPLPPRQSGRPSRPPSRLGEYQAHLAAAHIVATEPKNFTETTSGEHSDE